MNQHETFADIIDLWPSLSDFAADLGVQYVTAQMMRYRGSVRPAHWPRMVAGAATRGIVGVTETRLAAIAAAMKPPQKIKPPRSRARPKLARHQARAVA